MSIEGQTPDERITRFVRYQMAANMRLAKACEILTNAVHEGTDTERELLTAEAKAVLQGIDTRGNVDDLRAILHDMQNARARTAKQQEALADAQREQEGSFEEEYEAIIAHMREIEDDADNTRCWCEVFAAEAVRERMEKRRDGGHPPQSFEDVIKYDYNRRLEAERHTCPGCRIGGGQ